MTHFLLSALVRELAQQSVFSVKCLVFSVQCAEPLVLSDTLHAVRSCQCLVFGGVIVMQCSVQCSVTHSLLSGLVRELTPVELARQCEPSPLFAVSFAQDLLKSANKPKHGKALSPDEL